jgi:uncharacterized membrane protein
MKLITVILCASIVVLAGTTLFVYGALSPSNDLILHFTQAGEPDYIGSRIDVLNTLIVAVLVVVLNYLLARSLSKKEQFFAISLSVTGLLVSLLLLSAVSVIVVNNQ